MRVAVIITRSPNYCFMLNILRRGCAERVRSLAGRGRYPDAILAALSGGEYAGEIRIDDLGRRTADLVITEHSAHWDACKR
jgi:hypothetical protein